MNITAEYLIAWLHRPIPAIAITAVSIGLIAFADNVTGERLDLAVFYFIPITFIAWALGRYSAFVTASASDLLYSRDEVHMIFTKEQSVAVSVANVVCRLFVYLFVAEITSRLAISMRAARANAIELAAANAQIKETYAALDEDINTAGLLQKNVMQIKLPQVAGCKVGASLNYAGRTGGDFVDAGVIQKNIYVCLADIAGKGTPAALFTALLKHLLQDAFENGLGMVDVVSRINSTLLGFLPVDRFITMFIAQIDPISGSMECINAGHPPALICCLGDGQMSFVNPTTPILGVVPVQVIQTSSYQLHPQDTLVIYSDGATESMGFDGERLGDETIKTLALRHHELDPQEMADAIASDIITMSVPQKRDDLSIICVRYTG